MKTTVMMVAMASAKMMEYQIPSTPKINGSKKTAESWNTKVRQKEIKAEISPLLKAVKKQEPNIDTPAKR